MHVILNRVEERPEERGEGAMAEPFVRQVEDHSLPALQVLTQEREDRGPDDLPQIFVP